MMKVADCHIRLDEIERVQLTCLVGLSKGYAVHAQQLPRGDLARAKPCAQLSLHRARQRLIVKLRAGANSRN